MKRGDINVSIVTYKTPLDELGACIDILMQSPLVSTVDIVDNSRNETIENLVKSVNNQRVIYIPADNRGYGAGNNISIMRHLDSPEAYHLVINSDIVFEPQTLVKLKEIMDADTSIALTIPKVNGLDGMEQSSYHPLPSPIDLICRRFIPRRLCRKRLKRYEIKVEGLTELVDVPYVHGCFMFMRKTALKKVGLFDERYFMYPEDIDLTRRLHSRYRTVVVPWLTIVHAHRAESRRSLKMLWIHITNMLKYFRKWGLSTNPDRS